MDGSIDRQIDRQIANLDHLVPKELREALGGGDAGRLLVPILRQGLTHALEVHAQVQALEFIYTLYQKDHNALSGNIFRIK